MEPSVESQVENLCATIIKTDSESWETRNKAVLALNSLVAGIHGKSENAKTEAFTAGCYRALKDAVKNMVSDLRSQQVRDVCTLLCTMAEELGDQAGMRLFLRDAFSAVLDAAKVPNKVMSGFAHDCVLTLLRNCTFKSAISVIVSEIKENKAKSFREKCLEYINEILAHWELVDRDLDAVGEAVRIGLEDAAPGAREAARAAYLTIFHLFPERAANIKAALPGPLQGRLTKAEERDSLGLPPGTGGPNDSFFFPPQAPTVADEQLEQQGQMEPPNTTMAARSVVLGSDISTGNEENSSNINYNSGRSLTTSGASVKAGAASASSGASAATTAELSSSTGSNRSARSGTSQRSANSGSNHLMAPTASSRSRTVPPTADVPKKAPGSRTPTAGSKTPCTGSKTPSAGSKIVVSTAVNSKPPAGHRHQHGPGVGAATTRSARSEQDGYLGDNCDADSVSSAQSSLDGSLGSSGTSGGGGVWKDVAGTAADDVSTDGSEAGPRSSSRSRGRAAGGGASGGASSSGAATQYPPGSIGVGASTVGCQVGAGSKGSKVGKKRQSVVSNPFQTIITSPKNSGAATGDEGAGAAVGTTGALGIAASQTPPSQVQGRGQGQGQREGQGESKRTAQHPHPQHPSGIARPAYARHASLSALPTSTTSTTAPASVRAGKSHASPAQDKSQPDSVGHKETHGLHRCASTPDADALRRRPNPAAPTPIPLTGGSLAGRARIVATPASAAGSQRSAVHTPHTPHTETRLSIKGESSDAEGTPCTPYHAAAATTTTTMGTSSHIRSQSMVDVSRRPGLSDSQQLFPQDLHLNMHVTVTSEGLDIKLLGVVRFLGHTTFASGIWVGVELISDLGKNDGSVAGQRYFTCSPGHGIFVRPTHVEIPAVPQPLPVTLPLGAGSGTGKVSNSNGYNSAGALDRPPLSPRLGAQGTPPQVANSEQQSLKHFQSFQQASAPQPTPAADTCSVTSDAHSADSSRTGQGSVSDLATAVSASGTEGQGEEEGVGEAVGAGAGGSSAISTASGVSIAEAGNGSQGSDRVAVGGSGVRHRKGRATDILKLKLSQMMDLLNQQLEMVVELEEEDKKIETECTGGDRVGVGEATAGGGQSFDVEKVEALQREILAITDQEAELIQSFKRRFVRHMMQRDAD